MIRIVKFLIFLLAIMMAGLFVITTYSPDSHEWQAFISASRWAKYILMPAFILLLPVIVRRATKSSLTPKAKKMLLQCQLMIGTLFVAMEVMLFLGGHK